MITAKYDDSALQEILGEYIKYSRKQPAEVVNAKLYFIALQATKFTKLGDKTKIANELNSPSQKHPDKTLGELLVLKQLHANGKMPKRGRTLTNNMAKYVQRLINARGSHVGFLRAGWIPAIKKLDFWNRKDAENSRFITRYKPKGIPRVKSYGKDKGRLVPARQDQPVVFGSIFNDVGEGKQLSNTVKPIKQAGLDKAIQAEIASMKIYVERKMNEWISKWKRKGRYGLK